MVLIDKLGNYIERLDRPNSDLRYRIDDVCGITNTKQLVLGTKANLIGRTFEKFSILSPREFIFNRRTSRNGERISLGFNATDRDWILTEDYCHFRIRKDKEDVLDPDYLYLFFLNPEFDRYARYNSWGSATEFFNWEEIIETPISLIPISEQRKIVHDYQVITDRIELLRRMNENLEAQIMAIYHQTFDDVCREGVVAELGEIVGGATPSTEVSDYFCENGIVWLSPKDLTGTGLKFIFRGETDITEAGYNSCSTKMVPIGTVLLTSRAPVGTVAIAMKELCTNQGFKSIVPKALYWTPYIYCLLKDSKQLLEANASGTTFLEISGDTLKKLVVPIPEEKLAEEFSRVCAPIFKQQMLFEQELTQLNSLVSIRVSSIAKGA